MLAGFEKRRFGPEKVWLRKFRNLVGLLHWHDELEIVYINEGTATVSVEGISYDAVANDLFLIVPRQLHSITGSPTSVITVFLADNSLALPFSSLRPERLPANCSADINAYAEKIHRAIAERKPFYDVYVNAMTSALIAELFGGQTLVSVEQTERHNTVISLFETIEQTYATVTFPEMCEKYYYSPAHLSRMLKALTGMTFTDYLNHIRVGHAVEMLKEGKTVTETAFCCGYNSVRHFDRTFKKLTGYAPGHLPEKYTYMGIVRGFTLFDPTGKDSVVLE